MKNPSNHRWPLAVAKSSPSTSTRPPGGKIDEEKGKLASHGRKNLLEREEKWERKEREGEEGKTLIEREKKNPAFGFDEVKKNLKWIDLTTHVNKI